MIVIYSDRVIFLRRYVVCLNEKNPVAKRPGFLFTDKKKTMDSIVLHLLGMILLMIAKEMEKSSGRMKR